MALSQTLNPSYSQEGITDPAITESTSENTQEITTRELRLQAGANDSSSRPAPPPPQGKEVEKEEALHTTEPTPISMLTGKRTDSEPEKPPRATPSEINRIMRMLTDERYPTCGVYRRYEEGRLSDQKLLEAVSHELMGTFEEAERFRWSVEECVKLLKEEEGIA